MNRELPNYCTLYNRAGVILDTIDASGSAVGGRSPARFALSPAFRGSHYSTLYQGVRAFPTNARASYPSRLPSRSLLAMHKREIRFNSIALVFPQLYPCHGHHLGGSPLLLPSPAASPLCPQTLHVFAYSPKRTCETYGLQPALQLGNICIASLSSTYWPQSSKSPTRPTKSGDGLSSWPTTNCGGLAISLRPDGPLGQNISCDANA